MIYIVDLGGVESIARRGLSCGSMITLHSLFLLVESGDDGGLEGRGEARIPGLYRILEVGFVCLFLHLRQPRSGPKYVDDSNQASVLRGCWSSSPPSWAAEN